MASEKKDPTDEKQPDGLILIARSLNIEGRVPISTLTKMMLAGENNLVMKYLRTLPKEECDEVRAQLIKNLECT